MKKLSLFLFLLLIKTVVISQTKFAELLSGSDKKILAVVINDLKDLKLKTPTKCKVLANFNFGEIKVVDLSGSNSKDTEYECLLTNTPINPVVEISVHWEGGAGGMSYTTTYVYTMNDNNTISTSAYKHSKGQSGYSIKVNGQEVKSFDTH